MEQKEPQIQVQMQERLAGYVGIVVKPHPRKGSHRALTKQEARARLRVCGGGGHAMSATELAKHLYEHVFFRCHVFEMEKGPKYYATAWDFEECGGEGATPEEAVAELQSKASETLVFVLERFASVRFPTHDDTMAHRQTLASIVDVSPDRIVATMYFPAFD
jgi:hypothetical protein